MNELPIKKSQHNIPPFKALSAFESAARNMSFAKAASELNVTGSAISQQIMILEKYLSVTLFRRMNRRVLLTEAGELYYNSISPAFAAMSEATARIASDHSTQQLLIRSAPSFATKWLLPKLPEFMTTNPDLDIRVDATNEKTDFVRETIDIEIRFGRLENPALHVEPLLEERFTPLLSPKFADNWEIQQPEDLLAKDVILIHSVKCPISWEMWFARHDIDHPQYLRGPRFDRSHMSIDAARMGQGVALESLSLAQGALDQRELVSPFSSDKDFVSSMYWFVCPSANLQADKTKGFRHWLFNRLKLEKGRFI